VRNRLYLLRHAKSSWDDPSLSDEARPLSPRGERAACRMARHVERSGVRPRLVLCSPARRARQTLELVAAPLAERAEVRVEDTLYGAGAAELLARLRQVPSDVPSVMVVGHNPGLHDLALDLLAGGRHGALADLHAKFPTGALASLLVARGGWACLGRGGAELDSFVVPRALRPR